MIYVSALHKATILWRGTNAPTDSMWYIPGLWCSSLQYRLSGASLPLGMITSVLCDQP